MAATELFVGQKVTLTAKPKNDQEGPAPVDGVPEWSSTNAAVLTVEPATDGLTAVGRATATGTSQVGISADGDMTAAKRLISGTLDIIVKVREATAIDIEAGTPEDDVATVAAAVANVEKRKK